MTKTNCASCGKEIDTAIHPEIPDGHVCFDCHFDYVIMKGGYKDVYL